jgi:8-oxo-dGTP pyrophosphatase MutT (NUDIX family)
VTVVRTAAKAIIVEDGRILAVMIRVEDDTYYILPGGGQRPGETLVEALQREVMEELGAGIEVGSLAYVREYISAHHEFAELEGDEHSIEFCFNCCLRSGPSREAQTEPDTGQVAFEWLELARLESYPLWPRTLIPILEGKRPGAPVYLGDVN